MSKRVVYHAIYHKRFTSLYIMWTSFACLIYYINCQCTHKGTYGPIMDVCTKCIKSYKKFAWDLLHVESLLETSQLSLLSDHFLLVDVMKDCLVLYWSNMFQSKVLENSLPLFDSILSGSVYWKRKLVTILCPTSSAIFDYKGSKTTKRQVRKLI